MRDPDRIDAILQAIATAWRREPDLRLGQLIVNAVRPANPCPEVFAVEDRELARRVARHVERISDERKAASHSSEEAQS